MLTVAQSSSGADCGTSVFCSLHEILVLNGFLGTVLRMQILYCLLDRHCAHPHFALALQSSDRTSPVWLTRFAFKCRTWTK